MTTVALDFNFFTFNCKDKGQPRKPGRCNAGTGRLSSLSLVPLVMYKAGLFLLAVIAAFLLPLTPSRAQEQDVDPSESFLKAYMTAQLGEKLERESQFTAALSKFRFAGALIEELKKSHADWQPAIVEYRGRKISDAILRVQSKLGTQNDLAATTAAPPDENQTRSPTNPEPNGPRVETVPPAPSAADVQAAIQSATRDLRARVDGLEIELKKSQDQISAAQKEKFEMVGRLQSATAELEHAKGDLVRSEKAEKEVRDQLLAAQNSLQSVQSKGGGDVQATTALRNEIAQLRKALETANAGRAVAEKERMDTDSKLLESRQQVASLAQQRDTARLERDDALRVLRESGNAQARIQALVAENGELQKKLAAAENNLRQISTDQPRKEQQLQAARQELEKLRGQLVAAKKANQGSEKTISDLRSQLEEVSGQLAAAKLNGATPEESARMVTENQMLRAIVVRERQEEARREQAKKLMLAEFDKLKIKSDVLDQQIHLLAEPITKLSPEELALLKTPVVAISDSQPGTVKASLTMAKPASMSISQSSGNAQADSPNEKRSIHPVANSGDNSSGPEVTPTFKPSVPPEFIPLAQEAKRNFEKANYRAAEKQYQEILAKNPNNLYALSNLGVVLFRGGKLKAAELTLKKALALAPGDEFTHTTLGIVYYQQNKFDDALSELTKALAINPRSATAHNYLGITASQKGWQEAAEKEMLEAVSDNPDYADAHFNLAVVYCTSQPPAKESARRHYEKALALGAQPDATLDNMLR